jgi:hypothetical protein
MEDHQLVPEATAPGGLSGMAFSIAQSPDGSYWISVTHTGPAMSFTYGVPLDRAEDIANGYAANIKTLVAEGKRARSGLIIASPTHPNGNRATRRHSGR